MIRPSAPLHLWHRTLLTRRPSGAYAATFDMHGLQHQARVITSKAGADLAVWHADYNAVDLDGPTIEPRRTSLDGWPTVLPWHEGGWAGGEFWLCNFTYQAAVFREGEGVALEFWSEPPIRSGEQIVDEATELAARRVMAG